VLAKVDSVLELGGSEAVEGTVATGGFAMVRGWAVDGITLRPVDALTVSIGGGTAVRAVLGFTRDDVVEHLNDEAARGSGFVAAVPIDAPAGSRAMSLDAQVGDAWVAVEGGYEVAVVAPSDPFAGLHPRRDDWLFGLDGVYVDQTSSAPRDGDDWILELGTLGQIRLWALDTAAGKPVETIVARAGGTYYSVVKTYETPSLAAATGSEGAKHCGFVIPVMAPLVGCEVISIFAIAAGGGAYGKLCTVRVRSAAALAVGAVPNEGLALGAIDRISVNGASVSHQDPVHAERGEIVSVQGWAVDRRGPRLASLIELDVPGAGAFEATYGLPRTDVARTLACGATDCGFSLTIDTERFEPGTYAPSLRVLGARRDGFTELPLVDLVVH